MSSPFDLPPESARYALLRRHFSSAVALFEPYVVYRCIGELMEQGGTKRFSGKCERTGHDGRELSVATARPRSIAVYFVEALLSSFRERIYRFVSP